MRRVMKVAALVAPILILTIALAVAAGRRQPTLTPREEIPSPPQWIPFQADVLVSSPGTEEKVSGKFWRSSDGSERLETSRSGKRLVISIHNIPGATFYYTRPDGPWYSAPMRLPLGGWHPPRRLKGNNGVNVHPFRVSAGRGQTPSVLSNEGFQVYQVVNPAGDVRLEAAELNFFALVKQSITGRREEYFNVAFSEPPAELFLPPPGVSVSALREPDGIVTSTPEEGFPAAPRGPAEQK